MDSKEEIAFRKMSLLAEAIKELDRQQHEEAMEELRPAALEALLLHPGCDLVQWNIILCEQYMTELVDAFGKSGAAINNGVAALWRTPYHDPASGLELTYEQWAEMLNSEEAVQRYYNMIEKCHN